mmetsp:Transcript_11721/g.13269  ORF Transcript_11721/g.13269 Transcript_11721/m.13269 type:complete len:81 (+) Transcript_11721:1-243(+)
MGGNRLNAKNNNSLKSEVFGSTEYCSANKYLKSTNYLVKSRSKISNDTYMRGATFSPSQCEQQKDMNYEEFEEEQIFSLD